MADAQLPLRGGVFGNDLFFRAPAFLVPHDSSLCEFDHGINTAIKKLRDALLSKLPDDLEVKQRVVERGDVLTCSDAGFGSLPKNVIRAYPLSQSRAATKQTRPSEWRR